VLGRRSIDKGGDRLRWGWGQDQSLDQPHRDLTTSSRLLGWREGKSLVGVAQGRAGKTPSTRELF